VVNRTASPGTVLPSPHEGRLHLVERLLASRRIKGGERCPRFDQPIEPMTLGNMPKLEVRSLFVSCWQCHHQAVLRADRWRDDVALPTFGPRMVCTGCGIVGADARPNWKEVCRSPRRGGRRSRNEKPPSSV
jgi:hypothetical protein